MTVSSLLIYMTLGEIAVLAIAVSIFFLIRARNTRRSTAAHKIPSPAFESSLTSQIQELIRQTRKRINNGQEDDNRVLEARIQFLEAEAALLSGDPHQETYWARVSQQLSSLFPANSRNEHARTKDNGIKNNHRGSGKGKDAINTGSRREDISRLRKIIDRQHDAINDLKQSLAKQKLSSTQSDELKRKLGEIELAHIQLNMCVKVLTMENRRLNELLTDKGIDLLKQENNSGSQRIAELEKEIQNLEKQLQERDEQLQQVELRSPGLSFRDNDTAIVESFITTGDDDIPILQPSDTALFKSSTTAGDDDIPVLQPYEEKPGAKQSRTTQRKTSANNPTPRQANQKKKKKTDKKSISPIHAEAKGDSDGYDIEMDDDFLSSTLQDEINSFFDNTDLSEDSNKKEGSSAGNKQLHNKNAS